MSFTPTSSITVNETIPLVSQQYEKSVANATEPDVAWIGEETSYIQTSTTLNTTQLSIGTMISESTPDTTWFFSTSTKGI